MDIFDVSPVLQDEEVAVLRHAEAAGMRPEAAAPVGQAYMRALDRIVEAEVHHVRQLLAHIPATRRPEVVRRVLPEVLSAAALAFETAHRTMLARALDEELASDTQTAVRAVALVDLSGSTRYLATATADETIALVDGLYEAGRVAGGSPTVRVIKFVGDGFFVMGHDAIEVVERCQLAIRLIDAELPLAARAGVAIGPVVQRAGDVFGLPVNQAQIVTKVTAAGTIAATPDLASQLAASSGRPVGDAAAGAVRIWSLRSARVG